MGSKVGSLQSIRQTSEKIQILDKEYAYYTVMGKKHTEVGQLEAGKPLIVSLPNYYYGDRPDWEDVLKECEQKLNKKGFFGIF